MSPSRLMIALALAGSAVSCSGPQESKEVGHSSASSGLLTVMRDTLRVRNPMIDQVAVLDLRAFDPDAGRYVFIGYGVRADHVYSGSFADELFGVFVADSSLGRITRTLDIFPTLRWRDYTVQIRQLSFDSVAVEGSGVTYGDAKLERRYAWRINE